MAISGVGTVYNYNYNLVSKRISGINGQNDEFVQYCNGELKGEDSAQLNGYDYRTKGVINGFMERMQWLYDAGLMDKPVVEPGAEDIELSCEIEDITTTSIYVNREKRLTAIVPGVVYTGDEIRSFATVAPPFKTKVHQDYNPSDNSIHIAVGDKFSYGNGYTLTVGETKVMGDGYDGKSDAENQAVDRFSWALNSLLHFADQQYISDMIDKDMTPQILSFLQEQGVDTSREFTINETRCEVRDGRIYEVGNKTGIPNSIYNKALARYEESLEAPLNKAGRVYRTSMEKIEMANQGVQQKNGTGLSGGRNSEIRVSNFKEVETANYKLVPEPEIGGLRILVDGKSAGVFKPENLKIQEDAQTGTRVMISELPGFNGNWYDAIPVTEELESALSEAIGVEEVPHQPLEGYYIGTHAGTGIKYVMRPGDEGRGGQVLLCNAVDEARYKAL